MPNVRPSHVVVSTSEYRLSHGKEPRGRGSWAFSACRNPQIEEIFWPRCWDPATGRHGTYAEAKRVAQTHFAQAGVFTIYAQP